MDGKLSFLPSKSFILTFLPTYALTVHEIKSNKVLQCDTCLGQNSQHPLRLTVTEFLSQWFVIQWCFFRCVWGAKNQGEEKERDRQAHTTDTHWDRQGELKAGKHRTDAREPPRNTRVHAWPVPVLFIHNMLFACTALKWVQFWVHSLGRCIPPHIKVMGCVLGQQCVYLAHVLPQVIYWQQESGRLPQRQWRVTASSLSLGFIRVSVAASSVKHPCIPTVNQQYARPNVYVLLLQTAVQDIDVGFWKWVGDSLPPFFSLSTSFKQSLEKSANSSNC